MIAAVKKYGKENFTKEILEVCYSREDADRLEGVYFKKFQVLENKDIFYNRGLPGQYWRSEGHSEFVSEKMKKFYSNPENVKKARAGQLKISVEELDKELGRRGRIKDNVIKIRKLNLKIKTLKKERYKHYRELTKDLRKEFYLEKNRAIHKEIWITKRSDPEFLKAVYLGKKKGGFFKQDSFIYNELRKNNLTLKNSSITSIVRNYLSNGFKTKETLERNIDRICKLLESEDNIIISPGQLQAEAKIKYSHLYN